VILVFHSGGRVERIHYKPELLSQEQRANGIEVDAVPEPEQREGKIPVLHVSAQTKELWYEYVDRPLTELEQQMAALHADNLVALEAVATLYEMMLGGEPQ